MVLIGLHVSKFARRYFYADFIKDNSCDQRKLFCATKRLFNNPCDDGLPPNLHTATLANDIGKYFVVKVETIKHKIDAARVSNVTADEIPAPVSAVSTGHFLSAFDNLTDGDVRALITHSSLQSCSLDPMHSRLVSECHSLVSIITTIINKSLQNGSFPDCWKEAMVHIPF